MRLTVTSLVFITVSCVSVDEDGRRRERVQLSDAEQTMLDQSLSLSTPSKAQDCKSTSRDALITIDAIKRADGYVDKIAPFALRSSALPKRTTTVDFNESDLRTSLAEVGDDVGINIVVGDEVQGTTSVRLSDAPLERVLQAILASGGYDYTYNHSFIYVGDPGRKDGASASAFLARHSYKTRSTAPKMIVESLPLSLRSFVTANDSMGIVSISAPRREFRSILREVVSLDRPSRQIRLKLSVAYVSDSAMSRLGRNTGGTGYAAANVMDPIQPSFAQGVYDKVAFDQFLRSIQLMRQTGEAEIKAEPQITVLDGEKAVFGSKQVSLVRRADGLYDKSNALEGGISMKVEPRIVDGDQVLLSIDEAKSGDVNSVERDSATEQTIATKVRVTSGETLVLGGLRKSEISTITTKVPLLADIPVLGWLFKSKREELENTQVIFAIMPEITCN